MSLLSFFNLITLIQVNDLRNLLRLYADWHSRLLPYYNFDQFIHKVEQVGATKRVKASKFHLLTFGSIISYIPMLIVLL